jgi:uncharacterized protein (TIGR03545 family)
LKALVLDPRQLKAVQAAIDLGRDADSLKQAVESAYESLALQPVLDSASNVLSRLQGTSVRTLGIEGARRALTDVRRTAAQVDSAKARVERLVTDARRGIDTLQARTRAIDEARREDYASVREMLKLPTFDAPDIGAALFGTVTIDRFQQMLYWAALAREYAPPGLLPRESDGPERMRRAGATFRFAAPTSQPRFLLRRVDLTVAGSGALAGEYSLAASDITTDPAIVGRPTLFAARRAGRGGDSLRVTGSLDHTRERPRAVVNAHVTGVKLPVFPLPMLPYSLDLGRGVSEMRFVLDGDALSGVWSMRSGALAWSRDSARARSLNTMESLVARALTGIGELDFRAEVGGTLSAPTLAVRSNLDRAVADRLRAVAGEEIAAAHARARAHVDRLVEEKAAPVRAKVGELRADVDQRVADARRRLDDEKRKLEERLRELTSGLNLPRLPG